VQLGPRLLAIHVLKPYPTWSGFKPKIEKAWRSLVETVEVKGVERTGLRYINRIEVMEPSARLEDYFEFYLFFGERLPRDIVSFIAGSEFVYAGGRDRCRVQLTDAPSDSSERPAFFLDIDYYLARPKAVEKSDALDWVEEAHSRGVNGYHNSKPRQDLLGLR